MCIKHVHELVALVREIMANRNEHVFLFSDSIGEADMADPVRRAEMQVLATDEFIQNILLLMQRQPQLVPNLMRCLAYLAGVSEGGLGVRCLEALQDLMEAGGTYKQEVIEVMNKCVIPQLQKIASTSSSATQSLRQKKNDMELRSVLLRGLKQIAERSGIGESLEQLVDTLVKWLTACSDMDGSDEEDRDYIDCVITLCRVASRVPTNAKKMGSLNTATIIVDMLNHGLYKRGSKSRSEDYGFYKLLGTLENLARHDCAPKQVQIVASSESTSRTRRARDAINTGSPQMRTVKEYNSAKIFADNGIHTSLELELREVAAGDGKWDDRKNDRVATLLCCLDALVLHRTVLNYFLSQSAAFTKLLAQLYRRVQETNNKVQPKVFVAILNVCHTLLCVDRSLFPFRYSKSYSGWFSFYLL